MQLKIELSEKQLLIMREALEFYSRFLSGQVDDIPDELKFKCNRNGRGDELREAQQKLKRVLFPELLHNEAYGVGAARGDRMGEQRQISYEMYRQIYVYQTAKRKLSGDDVSMNVYDSPTMRYSDEKLIEIQELEKL